MNDIIQIPLLSLADMCRELADLNGCRIINHEDKYITYANPGMFYGKNFILDADENEIESIVKEIKDNLAKGMPGGISFTQERISDSIDRIMKENGFFKFIFQTGMVFDLDHGFPEIENEDIHVIGPERIVDWCITNSEGFPKPREDHTFAELVKSSNMITYGYMHGQDITSTGMLLINSDLSGIHEISTLADYRRQGQATAIICTMLKELKDRGIRRVSLQASEAGRKVYEGLGFEAVSTIPTWVPVR